MHSPIKKIVIVGGGTAGWMAAAMLVRFLGKQLTITQIESDKIGTIGVGEASIPPLKMFNQALGIDEHEFLKATNGTYKLGIEFDNWAQEGDSYMHAFGPLGKDLALTPFHHYYLNHYLKSEHQISEQLGKYSLNYLSAKQNNFQPLDTIAGTGLPGLTYAYHFDASLYAQYLKSYSKQAGVDSIEGLVIRTNLNSSNGAIDSVTLASGQTIEGDLFIDCSGFKGLLIEQALNSGYEDWRHWLPCDSALAVASKVKKPISPYTRSTANEAGWQWRIPLQSRTGNGIVYSSQFINDEQAEKLLFKQLDGKPLTLPQKINFVTGRRKHQWLKNCISLGLASGFVEPLESTSLHLVQSGIIRLLKLFPSQEMEQANIDQYNQQSKQEFEQIRDFIILHYRLSGQKQTPFWQYCREMAIPNSLQQKLDLFKASGVVSRYQDELFTENAWVQVMLGQRFTPNTYSALTQNINTTQNIQFLNDLHKIFDTTSSKLMSHDSYLTQYCGLK